MLNFDELIKNDKSEDNRYANALSEAVEVEKGYITKIENLEQQLKEKDTSINNLKIKNFDLLSKIGNREEPKNTESEKTIEEFTKELLK